MTQTCRAETGLASWLIAMRGGGDAERARRVTDALGTVTAGGNHHYLATLTGCEPEQQRPEWAALYGDGRTTGPLTGPAPTHTTIAGAPVPNGALFDPADLDTGQIDVSDVLFRMLKETEIQAGMAFRPDYVITGTSSRIRNRQRGNAVTPPVAEVLGYALVEAITGEAFDPNTQPPDTATERTAA